MITQEIKWGRYSRVWTIFLKPRIFISFISRARMMGMGKPQNSFSVLILRVFSRTGTKEFLENSLINCAKPTHLLSAGLYWLKSIKAICRPKMGMYLKTTK
jgi:hypothetical protein